MLDQILAKVRDIKSVCRDRLKAVTESETELGDVFQEIEEIIEDLKKLEPAKVADKTKK